MTASGRGETGRRKGLKIPRPLVIRVRLPSSAPWVSHARRITEAGRRFSKPSSDTRSRKKQRGELFPGADRGGIHWPPGVEKLQQLLARAIVVPSPVAFDDGKQLGGRLLAPVLGIEEDREIEPRLMILRIGRDSLLKLRGIPDGGGLFKCLPGT